MRQYPNDIQVIELTNGICIDEKECFSDKSHCVKMDYVNNYKI